METPPLLLFLNETFLDRSSGTPTITGYTCIARRDREWLGRSSRSCARLPRGLGDSCTLVNHFRA
eukprot:14270212-Alexandrium_andersonii.AAC.1